MRGSTVLHERHRWGDAPTAREREIVADLKVRKPESDDWLEIELKTRKWRHLASESAEK